MTSFVASVAVSGVVVLLMMAASALRAAGGSVVDRSLRRVRCPLLREEEVPEHPDDRGDGASDHERVGEVERGHGCSRRYREDDGDASSASYPASRTAPMAVSGLVAGSSATVADPIVTFCTATPGTASSADFTAATQCPQLIPEIAIVTGWTLADMASWVGVLAMCLDWSLYTPHPYVNPVRGWASAPSPRHQVLSPRHAAPAPAESGGRPSPRRPPDPA